MKKSSFRSLIKNYKKRAQDIEDYLSKNPGEWGKFQSEFNSEVNDIFRAIMNFERENVSVGAEDKVYKFRRLFVSRVRKMFERGVYTDWILRKPYGYAGDFKIIEDIYKNNPPTTGFDRLFDNYVQMSAIANAIRNRKNDFKKMIIRFVSDRQNCPLRIMVLASGPCREIREMLSHKNGLFTNVIFDCYDNDKNAIEFARTLFTDVTNVNFFKENAIRIAFRKDIHSLINQKYDIIYSTGLFDYFDEKLATRLIENLKKLLNPRGALFISDVRDKYSNPSVHYMEWVGEWELVYRDDENFRNIFINAGFKENEIEPQYEQQGILQYIIATNKCV